MGLKLYSTDLELIDEAKLLSKSEFFNYIELYIIPHSYQRTIGAWMECNIPFVIHAPHSEHGINLGQAKMWENNRRRFREAQSFADSLNTDIIIVHGGNNGQIDELVRQITLLKEKRIILENKPKIGLLDEICLGWSPDEFRHVREAGVLYGMALDFGHAAYAARSLGIDVIELIRQFMEFKPKIFHISDGDLFSEKDLHLNLGRGTFDVRGFLSFVDGEGLITIETPRDSACGLQDFVKDVQYLRSL